MTTRTIKTWHMRWLDWGWHIIQDTDNNVTIKARGPLRLISMKVIA